jgi:hypothetical protein
MFPAKWPADVVRAGKQDLDEVHGDCPLKSGQRLQTQRVPLLPGPFNRRGPASGTLARQWASDLRRPPSASTPRPKGILDDLLHAGVARLRVTWELSDGSRLRGLVFAFSVAGADDRVVAAGWRARNAEAVAERRKFRPSPNSRAWSARPTTMTLRSGTRQAGITSRYHCGPKEP